MGAEDGVLKTVIDYERLTEKVNRRLGMSYGVYYVREVHHGKRQSSIVSAAISDILTEDAMQTADALNGRR